MSVMCHNPYHSHIRHCLLETSNSSIFPWKRYPSAHDIGKEKRRQEITLSEHDGYVHLAPEPLSILLHSAPPAVTLMDCLTKWLQVGIGQPRTLDKLERGRKGGKEAAPFIPQSRGVAKDWPHLSTEGLSTSLGALPIQPSLSPGPRRHSYSDLHA